MPYLEVNHKHYRKPFGTERWPEDLEALCKACHLKADRARQRRSGRKVRRSIPWIWIFGAALLLMGLVPILLRS